MYLYSIIAAQFLFILYQNREDILIVFFPDKFYITFLVNEVGQITRHFNKVQDSGVWNYDGQPYDLKKDRRYKSYLCNAWVFVEGCRDAIKFDDNDGKTHIVKSLKACDLATMLSDKPKTQFDYVMDLLPWIVIGALIIIMYVKIQGV